MKPPTVELSPKTPETIPNFNRVEWLRRGAMGYLAIQSFAALLWWIALYTRPTVRRAFLPSDFPDAALLAFGLPDALLFIGTGAWAAWQMRRSVQQGYSALCVHCGAALYAALYCVELWRQTGGALWGAILMSPCLVVQPLLVWYLRPRRA